MAEEAAVAIARFDAEIGHEIAPFAALLRCESAASSQIENITASAKAIAIAELGDHRPNNAALIVANTKAMQAAIELANRLDEQAILDMHEALLGASRPDWTGAWRNQQVWIGGTGYGPHLAAFIPPHHERVPDAMADLVAFMQRDDLPVLVHATLVHAQFETIHPFVDGNGRSGRSLIHSLLRAEGLTLNVSVPVSAGLLVDTEAYFDALTTYRQGNTREIVELVAHASFLAVANGRQLVADLQDVGTAWRVKIQARSDATIWKVADLLLRQPVIDSPLVQGDVGVSATNVNNAIDDLVAAGVLSQVSGRHRNRRWAATDVLDALDDFAARAGR